MLMTHKDESLQSMQNIKGAIYAFISNKIMFFKNKQEQGLLVGPEKPLVEVRLKWKST